MTVLIIGLLVFLAAHSVRILAEEWRLRCIENWGPGRWKGAYSLLSIIGFSLLVVGFEQAVLLEQMHYPVMHQIKISGLYFHDFSCLAPN